MSDQGEHHSGEEPHPAPTAPESEEPGETRDAPFEAGITSRETEDPGDEQPPAPAV
jgi:hypothetical protein